MMFASIQSSQIPWRPGQRVETSRVDFNGEPATLVRRVHRQHNRPNPILVEFRRNVDMNPDIGVNRMAKEWYKRGLLLFEAEQATFAQADHARKVLTRLAALDHVSR